MYAFTAQKLILQLPINVVKFLINLIETSPKLAYTPV